MSLRQHKKAYCVFFMVSEQLSETSHYPHYPEMSSLAEKVAIYSNLQTVSIAEGAQMSTPPQGKTSGST